LRSKFVSVYTDDDGVLPDISQSIPVDSFILLFIDENDDKQVIFGPANKFTTGAHDVCAIFVKNLKMYLTLPLTEIYRCSMNTGTVPEN